MQTARVMGTATATIKHASLTGWKLLLVQLLGVNAHADGEPQLAVDTLGAAPGDMVLVCNDGAGTRQLIGSMNSPLRWFVMGIVDDRST